MTAVAPPPNSAAAPAGVTNFAEMPAINGMDDVFSSILTTAQQLEEAKLCESLQNFPANSPEQTNFVSKADSAESNIVLLQMEDEAPPAFEAIKAAQYLVDASELTSLQLSKMMDLDIMPTPLINEVVSTSEGESLPEDEVDVEQEKDFEEMENTSGEPIMQPAYRMVHEVQFNLAAKDGAEFFINKEEISDNGAEVYDMEPLNKAESVITKARKVAASDINKIEKTTNVENAADNVAVANLGGENTSSLATTAAHLSAPSANTAPRLDKVNASAMERLDNLKHSVSEQVAIHINKLDAANSLSNSKGIKIQLYPQELGEIIVKMQMDKHGNAAFEVTSNKASSLQLLQISQLDNVIQKHLTIDGQCTLEFGLHQEQLGQQRQQQQHQQQYEYKKEQQPKTPELEIGSILPAKGYYAVLNSAAVNIMV